MIWEFEKIKAYVKSSISEKRFRHVLGVVKTAKMLAERHGVDVANAELAALVHDVVKEQDLDEARAILEDLGETVYLENSSKIWHAPLGAKFAQEKFGITNLLVLDAVKYHTTGRPEMTDLEKVLFVADYTEPNRTFEGCIQVRALWHDLNAATLEILKQKLDKLSPFGQAVHPDTLDAYAYYRNQTKELK